MPLHGFAYRNSELRCEQTSLCVLAQQVGTPLYVYSSSAIAENYDAYTNALACLPHEIHFAVKANSSLGILVLLAKRGAGFDIVSGGELFRVLRAGGDPAKVVFSGVGKTRDELVYALDSRVGMFNCESEAELRLLADLAGQRGIQPAVALRVNPDIDAQTHPYISTGLRDHKFGIGMEEAERIYVSFAASAAVRLEGISCHIGSQIFEVDVFEETLDKLLLLRERLEQAGVHITSLDLGGGLGIAYRDGEDAPGIGTYAGVLKKKLADAGLKLMLEPGRSIVGQAGVLLTEVLYRKRGEEKMFVVTDAAMNDLIRPALYQSHHEILPVIQRPRELITADVVGPVCETGDFLARDRQLPNVQPGELLAVCTTGAYGFVLASNYNSRPRPAEVLVTGDRFEVIRERETYEDLVRGENPVRARPTPG